jgi:hypothetical protein
MPSGAWAVISGIKISDETTRATTATDVGVYRFDTSCTNALRMRISGYSGSGTITVAGLAVNMGS